MFAEKRELDQIYSDLKTKYGGLKEDYFALIYLSKEYKKSYDEIAPQVAFGNNDYGIDAYYIDTERRNLYLYQFKWSDNHQLFKESYKALIERGMEKIFGNSLQDQYQNQLLLYLKRDLIENKSIIDRVFIYFVFNGDPESANNSKILDNYREDLEAKKRYIDEYFDRTDISLTIDYISNETKKRGRFTHTNKTHTYNIDFSSSINKETDTGNKMYVGFIKLFDLYEIYKEMGNRLFDRNIRYGLSPDSSPNKSIRRALTDIVLNSKEISDNFVFNHNGVTLSADFIRFNDDKINITEPRVLNGAQTIVSFDKFILDNKNNRSLDNNKDILRSIEVIAKIILAKSQEFVVSVTINNNRQNPVEPWNLRASDEIQLEFEDKFREDLGIYYERQENAFESLSNDDLEQLGIEQYKSIQIRKFAQTLLAIQGEVEKISRMKDVFEDDKLYQLTFKDKYLRAKSHKLIIAYKVQFRLNRIIDQIIESGADRLYDYYRKSRNLVWSIMLQSLFNDPKINVYAEKYGSSLTIEGDFNELLKDLASRKVRMILSDLAKEDRYNELINEGKYSFLKTRATFNRCMEIAYNRFDWVVKEFE